MQKKILISIIILIISIILNGCAGTKKFTSDREKNSSAKSINEIRVLINELNNEYTFNIQSSVYLLAGENVVALIKAGNRVRIYVQNGELNLNVGDKSYSADYFQIMSSGTEDIIKYGGKTFRGKLKFIFEDSSIKLVNSLSIEDYLKGVVPSEMPVGRGGENYSALKAFAVCARTYALQKIFENKPSFDIYVDTRDQVYGGADKEKTITNKAVDDTRGMVLAYNGEPALVFYSAACGGHTEDVSNVFSLKNIPYLSGIKDGDVPNCSIAPKFSWVEKYTADTFVYRLRNAGYVTDDYVNLKSVLVKSRFNSGRVNDLQIILTNNDAEEKKIDIFGNKIRNIIKTSNGKSILRSTLFNVSMNSDNQVIINGKGYGHGVGLCQWGAIYLSKKGKDFKDILSFYFPGTSIMRYND